MRVRTSPGLEATHRRRDAGQRTRESGDAYVTEYALPRISGELAEIAAEGIAGDVACALERAVSCVRTSWDRGQDGSSPEDVRARLACICRAVRQAYAGEQPDLAEIAPPAPGRRMLESVRSAFLLELESIDTLDATPVVRVLGAMERVQAALDRDSAQRFANALSGSDGLDMVVEVAHDLRSPLASILFLAETLRRGQSGSINPIQERQLGLVYSAAFGLSALASDVIELVRGGERLMDVNPTPFSVSETLTSVRDIVLPIAEEKGLTVRITPPESDLRIGHPVALNRVLLNLTTNALKFTSEGGVDVTCTPRTKTRVEFSVRDTGRGIPNEVLPTLFDAFRRRVKPGQYAFSSAGLGLSICRKLVMRMGGEMQVETVPGYGTRFYFALDLPVATRL
jgi:signal transduction histidine kinase